MTAMSAKDCIKYNCLDIAYERFCETSKNWKTHWWTTVETIFYSSVEWSKKYILDPVNRTLKKIGEQVKKRCKQISATAYELASGVCVECAEDLSKDIDRTEKAYLFKFYEDTKETPIFSKIGTSARTCFGRMKDEVKYYQNAGFDITKVKIERIINCGEMPAEAFESFCRAMFIKKYPNTWHKNDRFFGVDIEVNEFDNLWKMYATF